MGDTPFGLYQRERVESRACYGKLGKNLELAETGQPTIFVFAAPADTVDLERPAVSGMQVTIER